MDRVMNPLAAQQERKTRTKVSGTEKKVVTYFFLFAFEPPSSFHLRRYVDEMEMRRDLSCKLSFPHALCQSIYK
ncbi:hypothetical protein Tco_0690501 [Tanacetum coccineum]